MTLIILVVSGTSAKMYREQWTVNRSNRFLQETSLHLAAMAGSAEDVRQLLKGGAVVTRRDCDGCTPLHSVAQSVHPSCEVARLLLDALRKTGLRRIKDCLKDKVGNTPLHVAAGNVNVSAEFINVLFDIQQCQTLNDALDTPFHVAAKSDNPATIVALLNRFALSSSSESQSEACEIEHDCSASLSRCSSSEGVDEIDGNHASDRPASVCDYSASLRVDMLDGYRRPEDLTLLELSAVAGNADAVALLIQNGADISHRLLHIVVTESVRDPSKTDRLTRVYQAVIGNALHWRAVREREKFPVEDRLYFQRRMQTVTYLLTRRDDRESADTRRNVLEHAIAVGAHKMLEVIVNTENVFRFSDNPFERSTPNSAVDLQYRGIWYIITNFVNSTISPSPINHGQKRKDIELTTAGIAAKNVKPHDDFDKVFTPRRPYLKSIVIDNSRKWRKTNILLSEPFRELTSPFINFVQVIYFFLALIQFSYMILFAWFCLPTACFLFARFGTDSPSCNYSSDSDAGVEHGIQPGQHTEEVPRVWWLLWPSLMFISSIGYLTVACLRSVIDRLFIIRSKDACYSANSSDLHDDNHISSAANSSDSQAEECETKRDYSSSFSTSLNSEGVDETDGNFVSHRPASVYVPINSSATYMSGSPGLQTRKAVRTRYLDSRQHQDIFVVYMAIDLFPVVAFSVAVFLWYAMESGIPVAMHTYVQTTSMIFLFGWTTSFVFFSGIKREFYLFSLVLREFIAKDICYKFLPLFFFTVVAFSFAVYVLQLPTSQSQTSVIRSLYDMTMLAATVDISGSSDRSSDDRQTWLPKLVFTVYVYLTAVILLNVLIAMINHRYDNAKIRAEREWRFRSVEVAMKIQDSTLYRWITRPLRRCQFLHCSKRYEKNNEQFLIPIVRTKESHSAVHR